VSILQEILRHKEGEVEELRRRGVEPPGIAPAPPRGFRAALLSHPGVAVIAEAKKASPSKGLLCPEFDPAGLARRYEEQGASAMSVLTDRRFFQGSLAHLLEAREAAGLPVLRKDFIIHHIQVEEARAWGADAILLIVAALPPSLLQELYLHAKELGMDCLVEVHTPAEAETALKAGVDLLGVNNRDLTTFRVTISTTFEVLDAVQGEVPVVSESGISTCDQMRALRDAGVAAALIGEAVVTGRSSLAELVECGR